MSLQHHDGTSFKTVRRAMLHSGAFNRGRLMFTDGINRPQGLYIASADKTVVVFNGPSLDPYAAEIDHTTGEWTSRVKVGTNPLSDDTDAHGTPAVVRADDGTLHCLFGSHASRIQHASSDNPDDATAWTDHGDINTSDLTYPQLQTVGSDLYATVRIGASTERPLGYFDSTDGGSTWNSHTKLVAAQSSEWIYPGGNAVDGSLVHTAFVRNPRDESGEPRYDMFHVIHDYTDDSIQAMGGTALSTPVTTSERSNHAKIFDSGSAETNAGCVELDENGNPHIIFGSDANGSWEHHHIYWDGSKWVGPTAITASGGKFAFNAVTSTTDITAWLVTNTGGGNNGDLEEWHYDGSWSKVTTVLSEGGLVGGVGHPTSVENGGSETPARVVFGEIRGGSPTNDELGFCYGADGFLGGDPGFYDVPAKRYDGAAFNPHEVKLIDGFERKSVAYYSGDTGQASINPDKELTRYRALELTNPSSGTVAEIYSHHGDGLPYYPQRGDSFRFVTELGGTGAQMQFGFFVDPDNTTNRYVINLREDLDDVRLLKVGTGALDSAAVTVAANTVYEVRVDTGETSALDAELFDADGSSLATLSGSDSDFNDRGVGWVAYNGNGTTSIFGGYASLV